MLWSSFKEVRCKFKSLKKSLKSRYKHLANFNNPDAQNTTQLGHGTTIILFFSRPSCFSRRSFHISISVVLFASLLLITCHFVVAGFHAASLRTFGRLCILQVSKFLYCIQFGNNEVWEFLPIPSKLVVAQVIF